MKLNLGCGTDTKYDFVNVDKEKLLGVNVVHDLNEYPYPFESESCNYILMKQSLEHIYDTQKTINECWRILKFGGRLEIYVPYYKHRGAYDNPTHVRYFTGRSFTWFVGHSDVWYNGLFNRLIKNELLNTASFPAWHIKRYLGFWHHSRILNRLFPDTIHAVLEK